MDWRTFVSSIVDSLVWPTALVAIIFLLRHPISQLIPALRRLRYAGLEVDFTERIGSLERRADEVQLPLPVEVEELAPDRSYLVRADSLAELAARSPRAAVLESWILVEEEARTAAARTGIDVPTSEPLFRVLQALRERGSLSAEQFVMLNDFRQLRNSVAHSWQETVSAQDAFNYVHLARRVIAALRRVG